MPFPGQGRESLKIVVGENAHVDKFDQRRPFRTQKICNKELLTVTLNDTKKS